MRKSIFGVILSIILILTISLPVMASEIPLPMVPIRGASNPLTKDQIIPSRMPVILDVDMATDVDDVTALRICEELSIEGTIDLKGVAFSVNPNNGNEVRAMEGALDYMGLTTVPIGQCSVDHYDCSPYYGALWVYKTTNHPVYKNAVTMYKDILRSSPTKVRIVTTGFLLNIEALLKDTEGYNLVTTKVDSIYIAGGEYSGMCWNLSYQPDVVSATKYVVANSPAPLYFAMDVLGANQCGGSLTKMDKNNSDFLSKAFDMFGLVDGQNYGNCDGCAVYCCAMQDYNYGGLFKATPCTIEIKDNGFLTQTATAYSTRYMLEATQVKDKYELYDSRLYTNIMNNIIDMDYLRKHPQQ